MPRYSEERKAAVLKKLLPPQNRSVVSVAAEEGISEVTLYNWLKQCRQQGVPVPGYRNAGDDWSPEASGALGCQIRILTRNQLQRASTQYF